VIILFSASLRSFDRFLSVTITLWTLGHSLCKVWPYIIPHANMSTAEIVQPAPIADATAYHERRDVAFPSRKLLRKQPPTQSPLQTATQPITAQGMSLRKRIVQLLKRAVPPEKQRDCLACTETLPLRGLVSLKCGHEYCKPCFASLITSKLGPSETTAKFPPTCCSDTAIIPGPIIKNNCSSAVLKQYKAAKAIHDIPHTERWFCPFPECSKLTDKRSARYMHFAIYCKTCDRFGCTLCNAGRPRIGHTCPALGQNGIQNDSAVAAVLRLGSTRGWRQCWKCSMMIEMSVWQFWTELKVLPADQFQTGCRLMTCVCRAKFW